MKRIILLVVMLCSLTLAAGPAFALSLSLVPSNQWIQVGGTASVDLVVSDLAPNLGLGAFDVDITFDPLILSIADTDVVFGSYLGNPDPLVGETLTFASVAGGLLHLDEVSLLIPIPAQPTSFTLATLTFTGSAVGVSPLTFQTADLSDALGYEPYPSVTTTDAQVSVPEPATLLLLGMGLAGLAGLRRKSKRA